MDDLTNPVHPVGGVDYPRTMQEFDEWFSDEASCSAYLLRLRWPRGFICPSCGAGKGWLLGIHQWAVSKKHLDYYLDEYTFRFNRRAAKTRGLLFYRLLQNAVQVGPSPYPQLTAGEQNRGVRSGKL